MVFFVLVVVAAFALGATLALIATFLIGFVVALIAGPLRTRHRAPHRPMKLVHRPSH
jgi:hypothetical protein